MPPMITKAEHQHRTMRALFEQAGITCESLVDCVREALGNRVADKAVSAVVTNPKTGLARPRTTDKAMREAIFPGGSKT